MGMKKLQGADGLNFELQMTVSGLKARNFPEESLHKRGNNIVTVGCWGGKLSVYINLPHAIRSDNVQPFQLSDCKNIESVRKEIVEFLNSYLKKHLRDEYSKKILSELKVTRMESNLTVKCKGDCKPPHVINFFEKAFSKVTIYKSALETDKTHRKLLKGVTAGKPHEWTAKIYDKTSEQREKGNLLVESFLIRVEFIFLDRMLNRMYSDRRTLEDILTRKSIKILINQYQDTFDKVYEHNIIPMLYNCEEEIFQCLTRATTGKEISETLIKCKEYVVDAEVLQNALKRWYQFRNMPDNSKRMISYYRKNKSYGIPFDVLKTVEYMYNSTGRR